MTVVTSLSVKHLRSHQSYMVDLEPTVTIVTGRNGSGKTTLLEAIAVGLQGSSFKATDNELLAIGADWWNITLKLDDQPTRKVTYDPARPALRKQFTIDTKTSGRLLLKHRYPIVLFEPEDLRLLHGSPVRRRQFIDRFISQLNPLYGPTLRKYERALRQRNKLLKQLNVSDDQLFPWNIALAEHGAYIIEQRIAFIEQINQKLAATYQEIAGRGDEVTVHYSHTIVGNTKQKLLNELHHATDRDRLLGSTSIGPHRHDVLFSFNSSPAVAVTSRGEARTIVLALKFLEVAIIERLTGKKPIILLDDVFSELDASRQKLLATRLTGYQIVITSATSSAGNKLRHVTLD